MTSSRTEPATFRLVARCLRELIECMAHSHSEDNNITKLRVNKYYSKILSLTNSASDSSPLIKQARNRHGASSVVFTACAMSVSCLLD
jgi:hypothetical protein